MPTHRAVHVKSAGESFELVDVQTAAPPPGHVRIDVNACGVCAAPTTPSSPERFPTSAGRSPRSRDSRHGRRTGLRGGRVHGR